MFDTSLFCEEKEEMTPEKQEQIVGFVALFVSYYRKFIEWIVSLFNK